MMNENEIEDIDIGWMRMTLYDELLAEVLDRAFSEADEIRKEKMKAEKKSKRKKQ